MLVNCLHLKPLAIPAVVSFPVRTMDGTRRRLATAAPPQNQFPYPAHPRPTPYQIFHLPTGATQKQVKARCGFLQTTITSTFRRLTFSNVPFRKIMSSFECTTQIPLTVEPRTFRNGYETRDSARSRTPTTFSRERNPATLLGGTGPIPAGTGN